MVRLLASLLEDEPNTSEVERPKLITNSEGVFSQNTSEQREDVSTENRLKEYFVSENVFNLSRKVLSDVEIGVLGKGLSLSLLRLQ